MSHGGIAVSFSKAMPPQVVDRNRVPEADLLEQYDERVSDGDFAGMLAIWPSLAMEVRQAACKAMVVGFPQGFQISSPAIRSRVNNLELGTADLMALWPQLAHVPRWNIFWIVRRYLADSRAFNCQFPLADAMCWNFMTPYQQAFLRTMGRIDRLPWRVGYGGGACKNRAEVGVKIGSRPGPRFYCRECAKAFPLESIIQDLSAAA